MFLSLVSSSPGGFQIENVLSVLTCVQAFLAGLDKEKISHLEKGGEGWSEMVSAPMARDLRNPKKSRAHTEWMGKIPKFNTSAYIYKRDCVRVIVTALSLD